MPWVELTRDVWDLDDDQLLEVLEALQTTMAQRMSVASLLGHPGEIQRSLKLAVKVKSMAGKWTPDGRGDGGMVNLHSSP